MSQKKTILVSGIHGFAGQYLVDYISQQRQDLEIWGISRSTRKARAGERLARCDLNDIQMLGRVVEDIQPHYVCHLAGINHSDDPAEFLQGNVGTTINLFEAIRKLEPKTRPRVLVIGSAAVYGCVPEDQLPIDEEASLNPEGFYGISKSSQDVLSREYHRKYGLDVIRARPFNIIGPGQSTSFVCGRIVDELCKVVEGHQGIIQFGDIKAERDFVDIRDVVAAYLALIEHGKSGEAYNVGSGKSVEISSVIEWVGDYLNISPRIDSHPSIHGHSACAKSVANIDKISTTVGWTPIRPLQESLKDMIDARLRFVSGDS